jgi:hypothetical protein
VDEEDLKRIAREAARDEFDGMGGLNEGIYLEFAMAVARRALAEYSAHNTGQGQ